VFAQEAAAAQILEGLLSEPIGLNAKAQIDEVIRGLCDADRILAETAIADAGGNPAAAAIRKMADDDRQDGDYPEAMLKYGLSWLRAMRP